MSDSVAPVAAGSNVSDSAIPETPSPASEAPSASLAGIPAGYMPIPPELMSQPPCRHKPRPLVIDEPNDISIFVQPSYDFFRTMAGIPDGVYLTGVEKDANGDYTVGLGGPTTGYNSGSEISFGLDFRRYAPYTNAKHPHYQMYEQKGPRVTLQASFGKYNLTDYYAFGTMSTEQVETKWGMTEAELVQAGADAGHGDFGGIFGLGEMIPAIWGNYDFTQDFGSEVIEVPRTENYFRVSNTFWFGDSVYNASKMVNVLESGHFGLSVNAMGLGSDYYGGLGLASEFSILRFSPPLREQHIRAELLLSASGTYYHSIEPQNIFQDDFWGNGHFVEGQTGLSLRFSTDVPKPRDVVRAGQAGAAALETGATLYYEASAQAPAGDGLWDAEAPAVQGEADEAAKVVIPPLVEMDGDELTF